MPASEIKPANLYKRAGIAVIVSSRIQKFTLFYVLMEVQHGRMGTSFLAHLAKQPSQIPFFQLFSAFTH
jgi:hypothetical protein